MSIASSFTDEFEKVAGNGGFTRRMLDTLLMGGIGAGVGSMVPGAAAAYGDVQSSIGGGGTPGDMAGSAIDAGMGEGFSEDNAHRGAALGGIAGIIGGGPFQGTHDLNRQLQQRQMIQQMPARPKMGYDPRGMWAQK